MTTNEIRFRVRYNEVDRMGYVHHGNYAAYFEMGRTELIRSLGISYKEMEDSGIFLPLSEFSVKYIQPAKYDDQLRLETKLVKFSGVRIVFEYALFNQHDTLLVTGITPLVFINASTRKPVRPPDFVAEKLSAFISIK